MRWMMIVQLNVSFFECNKIIQLGIVMNERRIL